MAIFFRLVLCPSVMTLFDGYFNKTEKHTQKRKSLLFGYEHVFFFLVIIICGRLDVCTVM